MLTVHRSETANGLISGLAEVLSERPSDPLASELVAVPTRGIERWLAQELTGLIHVNGAPAGITANIEFPSPRRVLGEALASARGADLRSDPWSSSQLVWPVLSTLDAHLDEDWMQVPAWFVRGERATPTPGHRSVAATKIARLFSRYDVEAPDMVRAWASGADVGPLGDSLGPSHEWQPRFWRHVREAVGSPSIAESLEDLIDDLRSEPNRLELPDRLCFYGFTATPPGYVKTIEALAEHRNIHLFVLHPSDALWVKRRPDNQQRFGSARARSEERIRYADNPLLASWGRDVDELQSVLENATISREVHHEAPQPNIDHLLGRLQHRIRSDAPRSNRHPLDPTDVSVQIHSCHGPSRQVDVARDAILHALADDPSLEPRDVIIMCPDVETYAPLIEASFHPDRVDGVGIPDIRIRTADRAPARGNPLAGVVLDLLEIVDGRATASAVLELMKRDPVRQRFRLDDEAITAMDALVDDAGASWGLDDDHRRDFGLPDRPERTWDDAVRRTLIGVFMSDRVVGPMAGMMPVSGIDSGDLELAGRLAELVHRLQWLRTTTNEPLPASEWKVLLTDTAGVFGGLAWGDEWQRPALRRDLDDLFDLPESSGDPTLSRTDVRALLEPLAATRPSSANHRTGDLTVCTLVPMRSVPHRVICLLGMDDDHFPRSPSRDGDDLLALFPVIGSRDPASEDRQLLLDALMAASDRLIVTYSGRDEHSNMPLPPAVPIAELLEEIDAMSETADGAPASTQVTVQHPLQPFDARNFTPGGIVDRVTWGFDPHMRSGARAQVAPKLEPAHHLTGPFELAREDRLPLRTLTSFFDHPVRAFCVERMGVRINETDDPRAEDLPLALDALGAWGIGQRLLMGGLEGHDDTDLMEALGAARRLPPGALADAALEEVTETVERLRRDVRELDIPDEPAVSMRIDVALDEMPRVTGAIGSIHGDCLTAIQYSRVATKHRLSLYVEFLALTATHPGRRWRAHLVGRGSGSRTDVTSLVAPDGGPEERRRWAEDRMAVLLDLFIRGMAEPLPLFPECSHLVATGAKYWDIRNKWEDGYWPGESSEPHHLLTFDRISYNELLAIPPNADEIGDDWPQFKSRFEVLAHRLWGPLLELMDEAEDQ